MDKLTSQYIFITNQSYKNYKKKNVTYNYYIIIDNMYQKPLTYI